MFPVILAILSAPADAADSTSLWYQQIVGAGGWPTGLITDSRLQLRAPGPRSESIVFQDTYFGAGGRVQTSPAFVDVAPMVSLAPIDVFDLDIGASWTGYAGPFAPLPFDDLTGRAEPLRNERSGEEFAMYKFEFWAAPTAKIKLGPVIAFDGVNIGIVRAKQPDGIDEPYWYEPYRDMLLAWNDIAIEHEGALLIEAMDGDEKPRLIFGVMARHRFAVTSGDSVTALGPMVVAKPGTAKAIPNILGRAQFYVQDPERVGTLPNMNIAAIWSFDRVLGE